ncbi:MAG: hypothetical protein ABWZ40_09560 [Caulobacterales bacterium]
MSKPKAPKLKVYQTQIGLHTWVVAAPNQKAALKAWDTHMDLFAAGQASVTTSPDAVKAAMQSPGVPVARALDAQSAKSLGELNERLPARPHSPVAKAPRREPAKAKKPDRSKLRAAEREAEAFVATAAKQRKALARKRDACLDAIDAEERSLSREERMIKARLKKARADYEARS